MILGWERNEIVMILVWESKEIVMISDWYNNEIVMIMGLGCNCDVLELFQSVQNANAPHLRPFEGP